MLIVLLLLLAILSFSLARAVQTVYEIRMYEPIPYTKADGKAIVALPSGRNAVLSFEKDHVSISPSAGTTYRDAVMLAGFIKGDAQTEAITPTRSTTEWIGEYRLHTLLSDLDCQTEHTEQADIEYDADKRWYVNAASFMLGFFGI